MLTFALLAGRGKPIPFHVCRLSTNAIAWQDLARQACVHSLQVITIPFSAPPHDLSSKQQVHPARACHYLRVLTSVPEPVLRTAHHRAGPRFAAARTHLSYNRA